VSDERDFPCAFSHRECRIELDRGVHSGEPALGHLALRTPVIMVYTCLNPVGYQGPVRCARFSYLVETK
jgi:hypothetical protein